MSIPLKTGHSIEEFDWANYYYVPYSSVYHTRQDCPHLEDSDNLVGGRTLMDLNGPYRTGGNRVASYDLEKCSWCEAKTEARK